MSISRRTRFFLLVGTATAFLSFALSAVRHESKLLEVLAILSAIGVGHVCANLWPDFWNKLRRWDAGIAMLLLALSFYRSWVRNEAFWAVAAATTVLFVSVVFIRRLRFRRLSRAAQHWPLTKGGFSGNYEDAGSRVIYYGYEVNGGYYSGFVPGTALKKLAKTELDALRGKPVLVRYKPDQPEISTLFKSDQIESAI